jgi:hypothetical protein
MQSPFKKNTQDALLAIGLAISLGIILLGSHLVDPQNIAWLGGGLLACLLG